MALNGNSIFEALENQGVIARTADGNKESKYTKPSIFNRFAGGSLFDSHPRVTGYFFVCFRLPEAIFGKDKQDAELWLSCTCEQFTPPTRTLNVDTVPGIGGVSADFVVGQNITRTFTLVFREYEYLRIYNIIRKWTSVLEPYSGFSPLDKLTALKYKGSCIVALIKPIGANSNYKPEIEDAFYFDGVFPENEPLDTAGNEDINTTALVTHSVTFHFDGWPITASIDDQVKKYAESIIEGYSIHDPYDRMMATIQG